jgi:hypothetical protein
MTPKKKWFNRNENPVFNTFVHIGMVVKILTAIGIIFALWYYF